MTSRNHSNTEQEAPGVTCGPRTGKMPATSLLPGDVISVAGLYYRGKGGRVGHDTVLQVNRKRGYDNHTTITLSLVNGTIGFTLFDIERILVNVVSR